MWDHCPLENKNFCDVDGFTYLYIFIMNCLGATLQAEGACVTDDNCPLCPQKADPVCGSEDVTYKNEYFFFCRNGVGSKVKSACKPSYRFCFSLFLLTFLVLCHN